MTKRSIAFLVMLILFSLFTPLDTVEASTKEGVVTASTLNIREKPTALSPKVGSLSRGDKVTVVSTNGQWHQIRYRTLSGYVHQDYISFSQSSSSNDISIYVNNEKLQLPISHVPTVDNSILLPFRVISEALGVQVRWNQQKQQVWAQDQGTEILFTLGQSETLINNRSVLVNPAPRAIEQSTVIPLRFFAETFGADVKWNQQAQEVRITREVHSDSGAGEESPSSTMKGTVARADTLNVRSGPDTSHSSVGRLTSGQTVDVKSFDDRWAKITFNGRDAYVHSYYLDLYQNGVQKRLLGQPKVTKVGDVTTLSWPKIGGVVNTSHQESGTLRTITTNAAEMPLVTSSVNGMSQISAVNQSAGKGMSFRVADGYQASISHTTAELIVTVSPVRQGGSLSGKKIVIDPGHGGSDPGAVGNGLQEKEIALDVAQRAEKLLLAAGAHVIMTRDTDVYPTLSDRVKVANDAKADLFISIHANAATATSANGTETYWDATYASAGSEKLAHSIHSHLIDKLGTRDRGVKTAGFQVIKQARMPSVLLELAFISNSQDAAKLKTDSFRQRSAEAILEGVVDYYK
ncbi:N-acetylmuramoyl-L-alanine amidase [Alkalihalophilus marmarensis]|uniref:N-acetylmuramoyl-L-alanine amidase n=1 Tax=Alkalihalophilus marmarensis DSM 21297 TaxID=1188261 RepID=U6SKR6_9BACI|nr:N-acetylmuramoyl-L-alanine amidase [Alkalihalophilus marmarensis]ERN51962.1 N-acetylmuramoyl-L-alanine amidase [Alkalihalophilus marmarensis DSM 21297]